MRGFSALTILVFHVIAISRWESFPDSGPLVWFRVSFLRVDLFFVLSGFVIALAAMREQERGEGARGRFLFRRLARLAPAYFVSSLVWLMLNEFSVLRQPDAWLQALTHLTFTYNLWPNTMGSINGVTWTLGVEVQLYLLLALLMPVLARWRAARTALAVLLIALLYRLTSQFIQIEVLGRSPDTAPLWFFSVQVPGMLDVFGMGVALALVPRQRGLTPATPARWLLIAACVLSFTSLLVSALWANAAHYWHSYFWASGFRTLVALMVLGWLWLAVAMPSAWAARISVWARYPGTISYGLFLWHMPVTQWLLANTSLREWQLLGACIGVTGAIAAISWHGMEKPIQEWARRRGDRLRGGLSENTTVA